MKIKKTVLALGVFVTLALLVNSCTEEVIEKNLPDAPFNPYDTIDYTGNVTTLPPVDSHSFLGLHTYIFSKKCGVPACHDGSFEPDFRTVYSAYNSLVYHRVVKNTIDSFFTYRVMPGDTNKSWLHERLTTDDQTLGQMPLYDLPLKPAQLGLIEEWILNGAEDIWGNKPTAANYRPMSFGTVAYLPDFSNYRVDTIRYKNTFVYPFIVPRNVNLKIYPGFFDTDENGSIILPFNFTFNQVKFSVNKPYDFSNAIQMNMTKLLIPETHPTIYPGVSAPYFYHVTINTSQFNSGDIVYMRFYVQDGNEHPDPTEIPDNGSRNYIISLFSFMVQ